MISPLEIQEKEFSRSLKGFKEDEVNEFLDRITLDLERILEENRQLRAEKEQLTEELKKYKSSESAVLDTLETAKALMGDISASAEKRAQILLKNAEMEAQNMQREAKEAIERMNEESAALRGRVKSFRAKYRQLLEMELQHFDSMTEELFPELKSSPQAAAPKSAEKPRSGLKMKDLEELPEAGTKKTGANGAESRMKTMVHRKA
ncbi:DivIVA domain-containing protein [Zhenpiania hominis]|uniref:DivIVA domain-containing protein n=1 Tax=Zhenpiania hominis TaxID=2763644 RepID=A0A923SVL5_9FIRM|nr:DivIVA domain-containing protein [Zhenpiania hominis]MBC6679468.1 DivIVA domain-containing protein [Zhenpiania hominis]